MGSKLEELNKELTESAVSKQRELATHRFPEEYVKKTLLAHGFFTHHQILEEHKRKIQEEEKLAQKKTQTNDGITEEDKKRTTQLIYHFKEGKEFHLLREPLNITYHRQPQKTLTLWPVEVDCISYQCNFLWDVPASPEPFYISEDPIVTPKIRSSLGEGSIAYSNLPGLEKYFTSARAGPNISVPRKRQRRNSSTSLIFESRFECGNLGRAIQVGRWDYELYLRFDLYTHKHTQWFYFSVHNMRAGQTYRFTIVNLYKPSSLYNEGMQPVMYSEKKADLHHIGWRRVGHNIKYFKTDIRRIDTHSDQYYYALTWSYTFPYDNDICYFAHCYPYTYTNLQEYLRSISCNPIKSSFCKQRTLCHSLAGNPVPILTITSPSSSPEETQAKRAVVITARVHPGETNSSWMMKGLIDVLTSDSSDAEILRDVFVFKIIPMLNPDGVIVGNYRCSLSGRDLNRNYKTKLRDSYPIVWHFKQFMKKLSEERTIAVYCDLHGHSRKQNVFIYGCDNVQDLTVRLRSRVFPMMLSLNAPSKFNYDGCSFKVQKSKEGTGRVVMWREMGIINSYTMEATFCGSILGKEKGFHFSTKDLELMGYHICDTLLDYCDPDQTKVEHILTKLTDDYRQNLISKLTALGVEIPPGVDPLDIQFDIDLYSDIDSSDGGSDSSDSDGPPVHLMEKINGKKKKHKKLQTRKERNRQKAQLKLTHKFNEQLSDNDPNKSQQEDHHKKMVETGPSVTMATQSPTAPVLSSTTIPANGGIPKFVHERMEEKQKKESISQEDIISSSYQLEAVAADYMKNGLPQNATLTTNRELLKSTASLLSYYPPCPMSIAPMILQQPSQSKLNSQTHLPQLQPSTSTMITHQLTTASRSGIFARNYVEHHLQDTAGATDEPTANHTKNLVSLSKLFRQLKPHLLSSLSRKDLNNSSHHDNPQASSSHIHNRPSRPQTPVKLEYVGFDGQPVHRQVSSISRPVSSRTQRYENKFNPVIQSKENETVETEIKSHPPDQDTSLPTTKPVPLSSSSNKLVPITSSTTSDMKAVENIRHSYSSLVEQPGSSHDTRSDSDPLQGLESLSIDSKEGCSLLHLMQPPITSLELIHQMKSEKLPQSSLAPLPLAIKKSQSLPEQSSQRIKKRDNITTDSTSEEGVQYNRKKFSKSAAAHKQLIASAVETLQQRKKTFFMDPLSSSDTISRPQTSSGFPPTRDLYTTPTAEEKRIQSSFNRRERPSNDIQSIQYRTYSNKSRQNTSSDVVGGGVTPTTVSLMLSSKTTSQPVSQQPYQSRSLHLRYYSNYRRGLFNM